MKKLMALSAGILILAACSPNTAALKKPDQEKQPSDAVQTQMALAGSEWGTGEDLPFIQFRSDGKVIGNGGCNNFSGTYKTNGDSLTFSPLMATKMACPDLDKEGAFFKVLNQTKRYSAQHLVLVLKDENGKDLLELQRRDWD